MNLKEQLYVCTLAETQVLSSAAKQLYISQPALSLYISNLEKNLGIQLFDRKGKKFALTRMGELYVQKAQQMLELKDSFDVELNSFIQGYKDQLRIGMQDIRSCYISPRIIQRMMEIHPNTDIILYEHNYKLMEEYLINSQLDIFFCNYPVDRRDFNHISIYYDELLFIINRNHPRLEEYTYEKDGKLWVHLDKLGEERFILQNRTQSIFLYCQMIFKTHNFTPRNVHTIRKILTMLALVHQGYGVGFCGRSYLKYAVDSSNILACHISDDPVKMRFSAIYNKDFELKDVHRDLIAIVKDIMEKEH